ncbi:hypothetical protein CPB84DRAFT_1856393 [Gymnopilus junonius]|uniref:Uncharacterized protein n=1 Tax=Gymnopilus junonius TaxID=109634 RepID=A0A9P5TFU1_GYMJU|nr:hypothetical protein CPB84DRAFT_1856393 [Gymnopilus junonius]
MQTGAEAATTETSASSKSNIRRQCERLDDFGFNMDIILSDESRLKNAFASDNPFLSALENYEDRVFKGHDATSMQLRSLLGMKTEYQHLSPDLAAKVAQLAQTPAPTSTTHEELFSLVSAYAMIERMYQYSKPDTTILPSKIIPKRLEKSMVDTFKIPYFEKLYDIPTLLRQIRQDAANMLASTQMASTPAKTA